MSASGTNGAGPPSTLSLNSFRMSLVFMADIQSSPAGATSARYATHPEPPPQLVHLDGHRRRVCRVTRKDIHSHRASIIRAEQPIRNLHLPRLAIPVMSKRRQRAAASFKIRRPHVIQNERVPALNMSVDQAPLNPRLSCQQPIQHSQQLVADHRSEAKHSPEAGGRRLQEQRSARMASMRAGGIFER